MSQSDELAKHTKEAADLAGVEAEISKVTDMKEITARGVLLTPALAVDGKIVSSGRVLTAGDIKKILQEERSER